MRVNLNERPARQRNGKAKPENKLKRRLFAVPGDHVIVDLGKRSGNRRIGHAEAKNVGKFACVAVC
jgi:hypothetical protein